MTEWDRNADRMAAGIETAARFLIDARERAIEQGLRIRRAQADAGHAYDTRADHAEGSAAAYAIACSALAGALQVADIATLAGAHWSRDLGMQRPILPDGIVPE